MTTPPLSLSQTAVPAVQPRYRIARLEWLLLAAIVLGAFAIRVYRLGEFPDTVLADEADNAESAVAILAGHPPENGFFGLDWTAQPAMSVYKEAAFIALLGFTVTAIRLPSALFTALALIPFYLLMRRQVSVLASALATILLATDVWFLNFSRSGWNCSDVALYMLLALLFLVLALRSLPDAAGRPLRTYGYFAAAGFACALGLYAYPAGRAATLAFILFIPVAWAFCRRYASVLLRGYLLLFVVEALFFAPQGLYAVTHWDHFNGRTGVVSILNSSEFRADPAGMMLQQVSRNVRGPWEGSVNNTPQYTPVGEPQLGRITGVLALAGMLLSLGVRRFRSQPETWLWWLLLLSGWVATQLFTSRTPNGARGIGTVPEYIYFAGLALECTLGVVAHFSAMRGRPQLLKGFAGAGVALAVLAAGYINLKHYIDWQSLPRTRQARYLYVTVREFPEWSALILDRQRQGQGWLNVGQWRELHPIADTSDPYGTQP